MRMCVRAESHHIEKYANFRISRNSEKEKRVGALVALAYIHCSTQTFPTIREFKFKQRVKKREC